jgi:hypothetical protein
VATGEDVVDWNFAKFIGSPFFVLIVDTEQELQRFFAVRSPKFLYITGNRDYIIILLTGRSAITNAAFSVHATRLAPTRPTWNHAWSACSFNYASGWFFKN